MWPELFKQACKIMAMFSQAVNSSENRDTTISLDYLFQCLTTIMVKKKILLLKLLSIVSHSFLLHLREQN